MFLQEEHLPILAERVNHWHLDTEKSDGVHIYKMLQHLFSARDYD